MADPVAAALMQIKVTKVKIVLSQAKVVPGDQRSGLWPRITIALGTMVRTFPATGYAEMRKAIPGNSDKTMRKVETELIRLAGGKMTGKMSRTRRDSLQAAVAHVNSAVRRAVDAVVMRKGGIGERRRIAEKRALKKRALAELLSTFESMVVRLRLEIGDVRGTEVGRTWDHAMNLRAVREVMET